MASPALLRTKPCRACGVGMEMAPRSRRIYCERCWRLRANEKMRRLRTQRRTSTDPEAAWHGTAHGYSNHCCRCAPCRTAYRVYVDEWRKRPEVADRIRRRARELARRPDQVLRRKARQYGIDEQTLGGYLADRVCFACGAEDVDLAVDHDHRCCPSFRKVCGSCVRGLLCDGCNKALGIVADDVQRLRDLIAYLERWEAKRG